MTELPVVFSNPDEDGLRKFGIEKPDHGYVDLATIDLMQIESFYKVINPETNEKDSTKIIMRTNAEDYSVRIPYDKFKIFYAEITGNVIAKFK